MTMKLLVWTLALTISAGGLSAYAAENTSVGKDVGLTKVQELFESGRYQAVVEELKILEKKITDKKKLAFISYWRGIAANKAQDFSEAEQSFEKALRLGHNSEDLNYEYGQALFASQKLNEARTQFHESLKKNFKRAICLYYMGFISKEMNERKKAFTYFKAISKLPADESKEVSQASEMQIGDIYLDQVDSHPNAFKAVETTVIPQYQAASAMDPESKLAPVIKEKIIELQRKYDLILFQLRNGRQTLNPPYFLRLAQEIGKDSNVTFRPNETTVVSADQSSMFSKTTANGRYTFYHHDFLSISPEITFNKSYYFNRTSAIYRNDNYLIAPALRTAYEHTLRKKPASFLVDYDFNEAHRDYNSQNQEIYELLSYNSTAHTLMVGERFWLFDNRGETVLRVRRRFFDSYSDSSDANTTSLVAEQIWPMGDKTLLFYGSYDMTRVREDSFDTNALTTRLDLLLPRYKDWFTPTVGLSVTTTDPVNNRTARGREWLYNPSARLAKTFWKSWRANLKFDYMHNQSKDQENFAYKKSLYSFELEYLF